MGLIQYLLLTLTKVICVSLCATSILKAIYQMLAPAMWKKLERQLKFGS